MRPYALQVGTVGSFFAGDDVLFPGDRHRAYGQSLALRYGLNEDWTLRATMAYLRASNDKVDPNQLHASGDTHLYARFPLWRAAPIALGGEAGLHLFTGLPGKTDVLDGASLSLKQIGTYRAGMFAAHYQLGYFYDRSAGVISNEPTLMEATTFGFSGYDHLKAGLRAEASYGVFEPYLEYTAKLPVEGPVGFGAGPQWLTPGVSLNLFDATVVNTGVSVGLQKTPQSGGAEAALPWTIFLGAAQTFDLTDLPYRLRQAVRPEPTSVNLVAYDVLKQQVMSDVDITLYAGDEITKGRGGATWTGFAERATYTAFRADYAPVTGVTALRGGELHVVRIGMTPVVGWARGTATNEAGRAPISLYFNGATTPAWTGLGAFQLSVPPGQYAGYATAPSAQSAPVVFAVGIGQSVDLPRIVLRRPPPPPPVIVIPELPPETSPERPAAVSNLMELLREQNEKAVERERERERRPENEPVVELKKGMSLDDFAGNGAGIADFSSGSWVLDAAGRARLRQLAKLLLDDRRVRYVLVQGSADDVGSFEVNTYISRQRAQAVADELLRLGVDAAKLGIKIAVFMKAPNEMNAQDKQGQRQVLIQVSRAGEAY